MLTEKGLRAHKPILLHQILGEPISILLAYLHEKYNFIN